MTLTKGDADIRDAERWFGASPRSAIGTFALLVIVGAGLPLLVASLAGALNIPRSDDWSYLLTLFRWVDHGRLGFNNWVSMTLVGQLVLTVPIVAIFGRSIAAVHVYAAIIGTVGLVAIVALGNQTRASRRGALLVALSIALGPMWAPLAATYMTDVPAFAIQMLSLAFAVNALRRDRVSLRGLGLALGFGFVAVSIRQYEVIPLIAVSVVALWRTTQDGDRHRVRIVIGMIAAVMLATAALFVWFAGLPDALSLSPDPQSSGLIANLTVQSAGFVRLTGLLLVPVVVWGGPVTVVRRAWASSHVVTGGTAVAVSAWMAVTYVRNPATPFVGNYLDRHGVLAEDVLTGRRLPVIPAWTFDILALVGSVAAVVLLLAAVPFTMTIRRRIADRDVHLTDPTTAILALTVLGFSGAYSIAIATKLPIFDRYALPVVPLVGLLYLGAARCPVPETVTVATRRSARTVSSVIACAALAVIGLAFSTDSASFDAARWRIDTRVTQLGYSPLAIYGGFEWVSYHRKVGPTLGGTVAERQRLRAIYFRGLCVDVRVNPQPAAARRAIARATMHGLAHRPVLLVALPNERRCAGGPPAAPPRPVK